MFHGSVSTGLTLSIKLTSPGVSGDRLRATPASTHERRTFGVGMGETAAGAIATGSRAAGKTTGANRVATRHAQRLSRLHDSAATASLRCPAAAAAANHR